MNDEERNIVRNATQLGRTKNHLALIDIDIERTPDNGRPYYCKVCGLGFGEYMACELPDCELESEEAARERAGTT